MSLETDALDAVALAATNQTVQASDLKDAIDLLVTAYAATKSTVDNNLNNVQNTADIDKVVSNAVALALAGKQAVLESGTNISTVNGVSLLGGSPLVIERSPTELATETYDNRANIKAIEGLQSGDSIVIEAIGLLQFVATQDEPEDDETCFNVATGGQWLLELPGFDLLSAYDLFEADIHNEHHQDENLRTNAYLVTLGVI